MEITHEDFAFIIAVKNGAKTIENTFSSALPIINKGCAVYFFDSCSTDGTSEIISDIQKKYSNIHHFCEDDGGLYYAWNKAIKVVKENFIFFLNADDQIYDYKSLEKGLEFLKNKKNLVAVHGKTRMHRKDGKIRNAGKKAYLSKFVGQMQIVTPATIFRRKSLIEINGFSLSYEISSDYDMVQRLLDKYKKESFLFLDKEITLFSLDGMSNTNTKLAKYEIRKIINKNYGFMFRVLHFFVETFINCKSFVLRVLRKI